MKLLHRALGVHLVEVVVLTVETAFEQEILEELEEVLGAQALERVAGEFGVLDKLHFENQLSADGGSGPAVAAADRVSAQGGHGRPCEGAGVGGGARGGARG